MPAIRIVRAPPSPHPTLQGVAENQLRSPPARERMMFVANPVRQRTVRLQERMNSPLQLHKVRLRGLGGPAVCGVSYTCASASRDYPVRSSRSIIRRWKGAKSACADCTERFGARRRTTRCGR